MYTARVFDLHDEVKDAGEQVVVSDAEARFELWRRRAGLLLAPLAFSAVWLAPLSLPGPAHRLAAILAAVVVMWITEIVPMAVTAFLGVAAAVVLQVAPASEAFAPFADPLIFLFIGTFMLARSIFHHDLNRRFAFAILSLPGVGGHPGRILAAYAGAAALMSMWISNTATVAMMFPIGVSVLSVLEAQAGGRRLAPGFGAVLLLSNAFAASIGGLATPVGTPPNLIGLGFIRRAAGVEVPFFSWMLIGLPVVALLWAWLVFDLRRKGVRGGSLLQGVAEYVASERRKLGGWTRGQVNTMIAFGFTVALWIAPGIIALFLGQEHALYRSFVTVFPEGVVALLGAGLLFLLPIDLRILRFTLSWEEAVRIDWWIVFLYGGGLALGTLAFKTGLAEAMGNGLTAMLGVRSGMGLLALSTLLATILSETTSNTASANMVVPVVIAFAQSAEIDPVLPAVGATLGASLGFMLPVSTPTNAIVYGSGRIPLMTMMRHGLLLDLAGVVVIIASVALIGPLVLSAGGGF